MHSITILYQSLLKHYGHIDWWSPEHPDEIIIGAILVQNTNWKNVQKALNNLKSEGVMTLTDVYHTPIDKLAEYIRPSGYYNLKSKRLHSVAERLHEYRQEQYSVPEVRKYLLETYGIGEETADTIILYAYNRPSFVVDSYTNRLFERLGIITGKMKYLPLKQLVEEHIEVSVKVYNEFHAFIVIAAKEFCRKEPLCQECPLKMMCVTGKEL